MSRQIEGVQVAYDKLCPREQIAILSPQKHFSLVFPRNGEGRTVVRQDSLIRCTAVLGTATSILFTHGNTNFVPKNKEFNLFRTHAREERIHTCLYKEECESDGAAHEETSYSLNQVLSFIAFVGSLVAG